MSRRSSRGARTSAIPGRLQRREAAMSYTRATIVNDTNHYQLLTLDPSPLGGPPCPSPTGPAPTAPSAPMDPSLTGASAPTGPSAEAGRPGAPTELIATSYIRQLWGQ